MSRFEDPCIITCSISGAVANREQCPAIPYTPEEYAAEAQAGGGRGRRDDPHPRAHAGGHAVATRSRTSARSPRRSAAPWTT